MNIATRRRSYSALGMIGAYNQSGYTVRYREFLQHKT